MAITELGYSGHLSRAASTSAAAARGLSFDLILEAAVGPLGRPSALLPQRGVTGCLCTRGTSQHDQFMNNRPFRLTFRFTLFMLQVDCIAVTSVHA